MNKTQRFRDIASKHKDQYGDDGAYVWHETAPGIVEVDGHQIEIIESTNFNADSTIKDIAEGGGGYALWNEWVLVRFEGDLYRLLGVYDSWGGTDWDEWQRVEKRPVTTYEYVEVDNEQD